MQKTIVATVILYIVALVSPYPFFVIGSFALALFDRKYAPLIVGVVIDIQFGFFDSYVLWYVAGAGMAALAAELIRPRINMRQFV